jgi:hypothetical protein
LTEAIAYYGIVVGGLALYMLSNKIWFGTFSPVSGQIKRWWGSLPGRVYDGPAREPLSFFGINYAGDSNTWHPVSTFLGTFAERSFQLGIPDTSRYIILLSVFALLCYLFLFINKQKAKSAAAQLSMVPLFACAWLQVLYYHAFGYSAYKEWYWTSQLVLVVLTLSLLLGLLYQAVRHIRYIQHGLWGFALGFGLFMVLSFWSAIHASMTYGEWDATAPYDGTAAFLEVHTEPGSIIGLTGGGNAGYFVHDRTVINMDGLINSYEYFTRLQERKAGEYLAGQGMDYILANPYILNQLPYKGQYQMYMEAMGSKLGGKELFRYHSKAP